ncbi:MAG: hypothetical protein WCX69_03895 [Candidatus Paceibacterota bacterium]
MNKQRVFLAAMLVALALIQVSLAPHFLIGGMVWFKWLNFIDVAVVAIALFEKKSNKFSWAAAVAGGVFLDLYSNPFGVWIVILIGAVALIKFILKKYVWIPSYW